MCPEHSVSYLSITTLQILICFDPGQRACPDGGQNRCCSMQFDRLGPFRTSALRARPAAALSPLTRLGLPLATIQSADSDAPRFRSMRLSGRRAESMLFNAVR